MKRLDNQIIEFISGEMDDLDRIAFEQLMESDADLKVRVKELQSTQSVLGNWNDDNIDIPDFEIPLIEKVTPPANEVPIKRISPWYKYAAAAAAVVGLLWISGLQINTNNNTMTLSFGAPTIEHDNIEERIDQAVHTALDKYAISQNAQFTKISNQLGTEIETMQASVNSISNNWNTEKAAVRTMMDKLSTEQFAKFESILNEYQSSQGSRMDESFADLMEYIDDKRLDDLYQIQGVFTEIVAAMDAQQARTDELFQGLVQPVATNY